MKLSLSLLLTPSVVLLTTLVSSAIASTPVSLENNDSGQRSQPFWTPERFANAKPIPLPKAQFSANASAAVPSGNPVGTSSRPPSVSVAPNTNDRLFQSTQVLRESAEEIAPQYAGSFKAHFSSSRIVPLTADTAYPYRAVGKLFFSNSAGQTFVCSGAVVQPRVVLTAGHCVHSGNSKGFYRNFVFVPAYRDGVAPYQRWSNWRFVTTTSTWASGNASFPNAADYAMIEFEDQTVSGGTRRIGDVVGWLGTLTNSLIPNHATLLGYPVGFDGGQKLHQVNAGSFRALSPNAAEYGSDMTGGSSGGPWVQDFGQPASGQTFPGGGNRVIGVTSYGYVSTAPLVQGSSIPDSRLTNLFTTICKRRTGNCTF